MRLKLVDPTVSFLAQIATERFPGLTGRFGLHINMTVSISERCRISMDIVCCVKKG